VEFYWKRKEWSILKTNLVNILVAPDNRYLLIVDKDTEIAWLPTYLNIQKEIIELFVQREKDPKTFSKEQSDKLLEFAKYTLLCTNLPLYNEKEM